MMSPKVNIVNDVTFWPIVHATLNLKNVLYSTPKRHTCTMQKKRHDSGGIKYMQPNVDFRVR
jgi:hypothetical protein